MRQFGCFSKFKDKKHTLNIIQFKFKFYMNIDIEKSIFLLTQERISFDQKCAELQMYQSYI